MRVYGTKDHLVVVDIICDICKESCLDSSVMNFECSYWTANWGYGSSKDTENWDCQICEACSDRVKEFIESIGGNIPTTNYI